MPEIEGKEQRKNHPGAAGILGVEGIDAATLEELLRKTTVCAESDEKDEVSFSEWYEAGFSGNPDSKQKRTAFLKAHGIPGVISQKQALKYLNSIYSAEYLRKEMGLK